jgi:hypothetical protein
MLRADLRLQKGELHYLCGQRRNWQQAFTRLPPLLREGRPSRLRCASGRPLFCWIGRALRPRDLMPNSCFAAHSCCSSTQTLSLQECRHKRVWAITRQVSRGLFVSPPKGHPVFLTPSRLRHLRAAALRPDGSTAAGLPGRRSWHPRLAVRLRIGRADTPQYLPTPRARVVARSNCSPSMRSSIYVLPPVVSFLAYDLPSSAVSRHAAPKGPFPRHRARGLPPRRACARAHSRGQPNDS